MPHSGFRTHQERAARTFDGADGTGVYVADEDATAVPISYRKRVDELELPVYERFGGSQRRRSWKKHRRTQYRVA